MQAVPKLLFGWVAVMLFVLVYPAGTASLLAVLLPSLVMFALGLVTAWLVWGLGPRRV